MNKYYNITTSPEAGAGATRKLHHAESKVLISNPEDAGRPPAEVLAKRIIAFLALLSSIGGTVMRLPGESSKRHCSRSIALLSVLLVTACGQAETPSATRATTATTATTETTATTDERRAFTGTWTTIGNRQTLDLGPGQQASVFQLSGSLLLSGKQRINRGFQAQVIAFSDTTTGMQGRSVWTDEHGDKVFSELSGEGLGPGQLIDGKFIGGTGRYAGISGEYSFKWKRLGTIEGNELTGRVVGLNGWARLGSSSAVAPTTAGGQQ